MAETISGTSENAAPGFDSPSGTPMIDPFGRTISYLRVSVTDRCDFRCVYCMAEHMTFLPKKDLLTLEELDRLCSAFIAKGVRKLRLTGGEPLVRKNIMPLVARAVAPPAERRAGRADADHQRQPACRASPPSSPIAGVRRDQRLARHARRRQVPRHHPLGRSRPRCMAGIDAAQAAGLAVKINAVALKGVNEDEIADMMRWAHGRGMDLTLIETMPMGEIDGDRTDQYLPLSLVRARLDGALHARATSPTRPAARRAMSRVEETGGRLGFITPLTHNFCESCNRVRLTCTGTLYMCLGQEDAADLRAPLRASEGDELLAGRHRRGHRAQAQGPRFHHRPPAEQAGRVASYERDGRISRVRRITDAASR